MSVYTVRSGHLHGSGYITKNRTRVRAFDVVGTASEGTLEIWDTDVVPTAGTYGRSGTTVTVTSSSHGLSTGDLIGISFRTTSGDVATSGNYPITVTGDNTFTLTDINTGTITAGKVCNYVYSNTDNEPASWLTTFHTAASDTFYNAFTIPDGGMLARKGVYVTATNLATLNVYYQ
jgi:WD40 repeat protein